jgi:hypothetical protein
VCMCMQERLGLAAEHGYFLRYQASQEWENQSGGHADLGWKDMVIPILEVRHSSPSVLQTSSNMLFTQGASFVL